MNRSSKQLNHKYSAPQTIPVIIRISNYILYMKHSSPYGLFKNTNSLDIINNTIPQPSGRIDILDVSLCDRIQENMGHLGKGGEQ